MYVIADGRDKQLFRKRLPSELPVVLESLAPFRTRFKVVAVESTYNWYRPVRDLLRRRMLVGQQRTGVILSLQDMARRQTGRSVGWRALRPLSPEERADLLGDHECLAFVTDEQVDLIEVLTERIKRFEKKVLEHAQLRPAYERLRTLPGVGTILALTIMLETGDIGRFKTVGDYTSYCRCVQAVHHALRTCPQAKAFYDRNRAKRNGALATKALAAKWIQTAYYIMKRQKAFDLTRVFG